MENDNETAVVSDEIAVVPATPKLSAITPIGIATYLEELPAEKVRGELEVSGILNNPIMLKAVVEKSLSFRGDEEYSAVIAALEPKELSHLIATSEEIFNNNELYLIHPEASGDEKEWRNVREKEAKRILASGDLRLIARLSFFLHDPAQSISKGIWKIHQEDVALMVDGIQSYLSAICNAEKDDEWKEKMVRAMGLHLVAYAAIGNPAIIEMSRGINQNLTAEIERAMRDENVVGKALDAYYEFVGHGGAEEIDDTEDPKAMIDEILEIAKGAGVDMDAAFKGDVGIVEVEGE